MSPENEVRDHGLQFVMQLYNVTIIGLDHKTGSFYLIKKHGGIFFIFNVILLSFQDLQKILLVPWALNNSYSGTGVHLEMNVMYDKSLTVFSICLSRDFVQNTNVQHFDCIQIYRLP